MPGIGIVIAAYSNNKAAGTGPVAIVTADSNTVTADSNTVDASGGTI